MQSKPGAPIATNAPKTGWTVTSQVEQPGPGPDGRLVDGYKVSFRTGAGVNASVFLPRAQYTPDNVRAEIAAAAAQLDQVQGMSG